MRNRDSIQKAYDKAQAALDKAEESSVLEERFLSNELDSGAGAEDAESLNRRIYESRNMNHQYHHFFEGDFQEAKSELKAFTGEPLNLVEEYVENRDFYDDLAESGKG